MLTDPPDLFELIFVAFSFLADTAFLVRSFHIIDSCLYGLYNTLGRMPCKSFDLLKIVLRDCISRERYAFRLMIKLKGLGVGFGEF